MRKGWGLRRKGRNDGGGGRERERGGVIEVSDGGSQVMEEASGGKT